jgi:hypothetical protein
VHALDRKNHRFDTVGCMINSNQIRLVLSIFAVATLVVMMDVIIMSILLGYYLQTSATIVFVWDFSVVLLTGLAGLSLAPRVNCPLWWRSYRSSSESTRATYIMVALGLVVVSGCSILNIASYMADPSQALEVAPWIALLTPERALALSFRAALNEEILFRLFLFPLVAWLAKCFRQSHQSSLVIGAFASSFVFGLIHPGFVMAFLTGLAIVYIYHQRGLFPAMSVHFLIDAISWLLISMMS